MSILTKNKKMGYLLNCFTSRSHIVRFGKENSNPVSRKLGVFHGPF